MENTPPQGAWTYPRRLVLAVAAVVLLALGWFLADVFVLLFGSIVFAVVVDAVARPLRRLNLSQRAAVIVAVLLLVILVAGIGALVGGALAEQVAQLRDQIPRAWQATIDWLERHALGRQLLDALGSAWGDSRIPAPRLAGIAGSALGAIGFALLMLIVAVYLAADPRLYRDGAVQLVPHASRPRFRDALDRSGEGLRRWLLGQAVSMLFIGFATALGLWLLDVPLALTLGLITGLLAFVPFYGSIAGGVLSVLMGFVAGPQTALWVALLYVAVQQLEELLLQPLAQRWAVALPPVLGLIAALIFGVLFGPLGVVFATPMMVMVMILVRALYIEGVLDRRGTPTSASPSN